MIRNNTPFTWKTLLSAASLLLAACLVVQGQSARVPGFRPSTSGFHFVNYFQLPTLNIAGVEFGGTPYGLCGGMGFAARDYYESGRPIPCDTTPPSSGPLYDYLVARLIDSFNLPFGPPKYADWMRRPDHDTWFERGTAWLEITEEWPWIRAELDQGILSPLALIRVKSLFFPLMVENHQVLAYGYDLVGTSLTLLIYDPNHPNDDSVTLTVDIGVPEHTSPITYSTGEIIYAFFHPNYGFTVPPSLPDSVPPTIYCPSDVSANAGNECSVIVNYNPPTALDACSGVTTQCVPPSGSDFPLGNTTVDCSATDSAGNTATCSFQVQVIANPSAVSLVCPPDQVVPAQPNEAAAVVQYSLPSLGRNPGCVTVQCTPPTGSSFPLGSTAVNCVATHSSGAIVGQCSFIVTVNCASAPTPMDGIGLLATYYDNVDFTLPKMLRIEPVNFDWGIGSPGYGISPDTFSVRWSGQVTPLFTDAYTFYTVSDDGVRLWVDGRQIINNWTDHPATEDSGTISLVGGQKYDLVMEFYENGGGAAAKLLWSSSCQPKEIIPAQYLFPAAPECPCSVVPGFFSDFDAGLPAGMTLFGDAAIDGGWLRLTMTNNAYGIVYIDDFGGGKLVAGFHATFKAALFGSICCGNGASPADGFSFNLVPASTVRPNPGYAEPAEEGLNEGLAVNFDTWDNGNNEAPAVEVKWLGQVIASASFQSSQSPGGISDPVAASREVVIDLDEHGVINVSYGGTPLISNMPTPYNAALIGVPKWVLGARNGSGNDNHWINDLRIVAQPMHGLPIPGLFNTGIDANGALLPAGAADPHYRLTRSADSTAPGPTALAVEETWPVAPNGPWVANGPDSKWIAPQGLQLTGNQPGDYLYELDFDLSLFDAGTATIVGRWSTDNPGVDILINGISTGQGSVAFASWTGFQITTGFRAGMNTLTFVVRNLGDAPNPTGLRVELCGAAQPRCLSFELFEPVALPNPWPLLGRSYSVFNFDGSMMASAQIRTDQGPGGLQFTGLNCGYKLEIDLAMPCYSVQLRLVQFSSPGTVTAFNANGVVVASQTMTATQWLPQTLTLNGADITKVVVTAPNNETLLLDLCSRAEYPPSPLRTSISRQDGQIVVCWNSRPGKTYCVEYKTKLIGPWQPHPAGCVQANDITTCVWDASAGQDPVRFYRVVEQP